LKKGQKNFFVRLGRNWRANFFNNSFSTKAASNWSAAAAFDNQNMTYTLRWKKIGIVENL
jgi:hypothetical protein